MTMSIPTQSGSEAAVASGTIVREPGTLRCAVRILAVKLALRALGLTGTLRLVRRVGRVKAATTIVPRPAVESVARRVATAAAFFPARAACLEQSLVLHYSLLRMRVPSRFRVGAQPINFAAHAWVEYEGAPVLETEIIRTIIPFPDLPA
jgi:hypothetical protein